jgi:spore coat protein U-like protein
MPTASFLGFLARAGLTAGATAASSGFSRGLLLTGILLAISLVPHPAEAALSCSFSMGSVNFGTIDVTQNTTFTTTATWSATCSGGNANATARICISFGGGLGGISGTGSPRYLANGANTLSYELYQDAANTTIWGSWVWNGAGGNGAELDVPLNGSGNGSGSKTVYATVLAGQQTVTPATYSSSFAASEVETDWGYTTQATCASLNLPHADSVPTFNVSATVATACNVSASTLNFGSVGQLSSNVDATTTVSATCSNTTPYTVSLSLGSGSGVTLPTARKMTNGGNTVTYGLYQNSARTTAWGDVIGTNTEAGTGTGLSQSYTVYGRVPSQTTPAPATYTDSIVTTVTY